MGSVLFSPAASGYWLPANNKRTETTAMTNARKAASLCWSFLKSRSLFDFAQILVFAKSSGISQPIHFTSFRQSIEMWCFFYWSSGHKKLPDVCAPIAGSGPSPIHPPPKETQTSITSNKRISPKKEFLRSCFGERKSGSTRSAAMCLHAQFLGVVRALQQVVQGPEVLWLSGLELSAQITQSFGHSTCSCLISKENQ